MRIWLDDERQPPEESDYIWIRHPDDCIEILKSGLVQDISLDHDLGTELNGHDVVVFIENLFFTRGIIPTLCRIHSPNPVGAQRMKIALERLSERASAEGETMTVLYEPYIV